MADLSPERPDDIGQLMLVGALALAIVLVALTLLVNSAIYTQTVATRGAGPTGGSDAVGFRSATDRVVVDTIETVNDNEVGYDNQTEQLRETLPNVSAAMGTYAAERGRSVSVSYVTQDNGTRIERTEDGEITDYTVPDVETRAFAVNVNRSTFPGDDGTGSGPPTDSDVLSNLDTEYRIDFENSTTGDEIQVAVFKDDDVSPNQTIVAVYLNEDRQGFCTDDTGSRTRIDIDDAYVGGEYCLPLEIFDDVGQPTDVVFVNGLDLVGDPGEARYEYVVDANNGSFTVPAGISKTAVLYSVEVDVTYRTPELKQAARLRVIPEAADE